MASTMTAAPSAPQTSKYLDRVPRVAPTRMPPMLTISIPSISDTDVRRRRPIAALSPPTSPVSSLPSSFVHPPTPRPRGIPIEGIDGLSSWVGHLNNLAGLDRFGRPSKTPRRSLETIWSSSEEEDAEDGAVNEHGADKTNVMASTSDQPADHSTSKDTATTSQALLSQTQMLFQRNQILIKNVRETQQQIKNHQQLSPSRRTGPTSSASTQAELKQPTDSEALSAMKAREANLLRELTENLKMISAVYQSSTRTAL